jgi:hypothetical protein
MQIIISGPAWEQNMPTSIEAFFFVDGKSDEAIEGREFAQQAHADFVHHYPMASVPLLRLDTKRWDAPFHTVRSG